MAVDIPEPIKKQCEEKGGLKGIISSLPSDKAIESNSQIFQALSDSLRLKTLYALVEQPLCACLIREILDISDSKLSYHLSILKDAGLIAGNKQGNWIIYSPTELGRTLVRMVDKL